MRSLSEPTQRNAGRRPASRARPGPQRRRPARTGRGRRRSRSPRSCRGPRAPPPRAAPRSQSETATTRAARRTASRVARRTAAIVRAFATSWPWAVRTSGARDRERGEQARRDEEVRVDDVGTEATRGDDHVAGEPEMTRPAATAVDDRALDLVPALGQSACSSAGDERPRTPGRRARVHLRDEEDPHAASARASPGRPRGTSRRSSPRPRARSGARAAPRSDASWRHVTRSVSPGLDLHRRLEQVRGLPVEVSSAGCRAGAWRQAVPGFSSTRIERPSRCMWPATDWIVSRPRDGSVAGRDVVDATGWRGVLAADDVEGGRDERGAAAEPLGLVERPPPCARRGAPTRPCGTRARPAPEGEVVETGFRPAVVGTVVSTARDRSGRRPLRRL